MKKCPKCKSEIGEESRFCVYCMTSFEEKQVIKTQIKNNKRWIYIIATVLAFVFIALCLLIFTQKGKTKEKEKENENDTSTNVSISSDLDVSSANSTTSSHKTNTISSGTTTNNSSTASIQSNTSSNPKTSTNNTASNKPTTSTSKVTSSNTTTSSNAITGTTPETKPKYDYIDATTDNTYPTSNESLYAPVNAIVITKVKYKEKSGHYVIPDTIDGKKVAAIMPTAFSDSVISASVKSVTLPSTVRSIWHNAFENCYNLTDLYLKSEVIEIYKDSFPEPSKRSGKLIIHCRNDCRNFNFYYYRNIVGDYNADYIEWYGD